MTPGSPRPEINDYELLSEIGSGSYGTVWMARSVTGLLRAVKVVRRSSFPDAEPYDREFRGLQEFAAVAGSEQRLLSIYHVGRNEAARFFYYVMDLADDAVRGAEIDPRDYVPRTLREFCATRGRMSAAEVLELGIGLADALAGLHDHSLVHRDIKPSNIIFVAGIPKLADVGLVVAGDPGEESRSRVGNAGYMPPDFPGVASADVYGLGLVLYELATGLDRSQYPRLPPDLGERPDRRALLELNEVINKACSREARERYAHARALLEDLWLLQAGKSVRRLRATERHLSRALRVAALLGVVALVAGTGAWVEHLRAEGENARRRMAETERDLLAQQVLYSSALIQSQEAMDREDYGRARAVLRAAPNESTSGSLRSIEWNALMGRAHGAHSDREFDGERPVMQLLADPSGRFLVAWQADRNVTVLDADTLRPLRRISHVARVLGLTQDGWIWAENSTTGTLSAWSALSEEVRPGAPRPGNSRLLGLVADGNILAAEMPAGEFSLLHPVEGRIVHRFAVAAESADPWTVFRHFINARGTHALVTLIQGRGTAARWRLVALDLVTRRILWDEPAPGLPVSLGRLESDGTFLLTVGQDGLIMARSEADRGWRIWGRSEHEIQVMTERPNEPGTLLCAGRAPTVFLVDASGTHSGVRWHGHGGRVQSIVPSADGRLLYTASTDGTVRRWNGRPEPSSTAKIWDARGGLITLVASPRGDRLFAAHDEASVAVLSTTGGRTLATWDGMGMPFAARGNSLWTQTPSGEALVCWNVSQPTQPESSLRCDTDTQLPLIRPTCSPDGRQVAAGTEDGRLWLWSAESGHVSWAARPHKDAPWGYVFDPPRSRLWSVGNDRDLVASDLATGAVVKRLPLSGRTPGVELSPDGATLALVFTDGTLELRSADTGEVRVRRSAAPGLATCARYSADGKRLLIGGASGTIYVVDALDGRPIVSLSAGFRAPVAQIAVSPTLDWWAVAAANGELHGWELFREDDTSPAAGRGK